MSTPEERRKLIAELDHILPEDLKAIAAMPIMDPGRVYLPAGKISEAEYRARQARILAGEQP
ncbi:hypothetical protein [Sphingobium fluviale]|uniref:Uncharacterized protein n=1 Tax=Sphingobium fluviale TaxID=2506423 RepID=A0A4V1N3K0_9SPHN|nr:hypothetical protein [Sphingobium fluviale]RXR28936.1 hypothetical protein EQG66_07615 [Sphingobium fluviale]